MWLVDISDQTIGDTVALVGDHADFTDGAVALTTHTGAGDTTGITIPNFPFDCRTGKKWWVETAFQLSDHDNMEFFFGLHEAQYASNTILATAAIGASADALAFVKDVHNVDAITVKQHRTDGSGDAGALSNALDSALSVANDTDVVRLGIHWDGNGMVKYYGSVTTSAVGYGSEAMPLVYQSSVGVPEEGVKLALSLQVATGGAADVCDLNFIRGAWEV